MSGFLPVLVAEDDPTDALLLQMAVRKTGLRMHLQVVRDGEQAIDYLLGRNGFDSRSAHPYPRLLLLDLKMPKVDGFQVLDFVRQEPALRRLPVIILSSSDDPNDIHRAYESGANSYVCKPNSSESLFELLDALERYWIKFNRFPE